MRTVPTFRLKQNMVKFLAQLRVYQLLRRSTFQVVIYLNHGLKPNKFSSVVSIMAFIQKVPVRERAILTVVQFSEHLTEDVGKRKAVGQYLFQHSILFKSHSILISTHIKRQFYGHSCCATVRRSLLVSEEHAVYIFKASFHRRWVQYISLVTSAITCTTKNG